MRARRPVVTQAIAEAGHVVLEPEEAEWLALFGEKQRSIGCAVGSPVLDVLVNGLGGQRIEPDLPRAPALACHGGHQNVALLDRRSAHSGCHPTASKAWSHSCRPSLLFVVAPTS